MKRACLLIVATLALLLGPALQTAEAHGRHGGWGRFGGGAAYRHWGGGWGGGYRSIGFGSYGFRSYGFGYRPAFGISVGYQPFNTFYRPFYGVPFGSWGYGGYGYGFGGYYGGYYPVHYSLPYYNSSIYFYNQSPGFYNSYYAYPTCYYSAYYTPPVVNVTRIVVRKAAEPAPVAAEGKIVRSSTITDRSRARQLIKLGDAAFLAGRYPDALNRYRSAAETAPDYAEAHYRKGHAYVANARYELAADSFRRGLDLEPDARRDGFRLDDLYGDKSAAKGVHLENLAAAALMAEDVADNYFLLGLMLRFNGEEERAEKFFTKAITLADGAALARR